MLVNGIDHVHLTAPKGSEDRVRAFYGDVLSLPEIPAPPPFQATGGVWFDCGNVHLLVGIEDDPSATGAHRHVAFRVADLEAVRLTLDSHGYAVEDDPAPTPGLKKFYCRDAVGNRLEFVEGVQAAASRGPRRLKPEVARTYPVSVGEVERVAASPEGTWLAAGTTTPDASAGEPSLLIWRMGGADEAEFEVEMSASVWELAFSPNGRELAALSEDGSLETWRVGDFESDQYAELTEGSAGLAYSEDGGLLAVGAGDTVEVFRPGLNQLLTVRPSLGQINALAFDLNDTLAISGELTRIQLWQVKPVQLSSWELIGHSSPAVQMRFNAHHPVLAAVTEAGQLLVWDINEGPEAPRDLTGDLGDFNAIAFSPDGEWLAAGTEAGHIRLFDWQAGSGLVDLEAESPVLSVAFTADGAHLIAGLAGGQVVVWQLS